jgi:hypothetical protein
MDVRHIHFVGCDPCVDPFPENGDRARFPLKFRGTAFRLTLGIKATQAFQFADNIF